ncbi:deoxyxylulose-5-phosphate synthase [Streptomyces sp. NPDC051840]|uniref:deoxyxylulose-5-phosphate synthase n=1 Tax=unclassified Streptomyces TaxID=2593676 RepID=UPI003434227B
MPPAKSSFVCLSCRASYKQPGGGSPERRCPGCAGALIGVGSAFAAPKRRDTAAWRALSVLLNAGIRFRMGCCTGPGYRPRTLREVKERMAHAERAGEPYAKALVREHLYDCSA